MTKLEEKLGYCFCDKTKLTNALTHSSYANETHYALGSNERLEFLGDSILGMTVADFLYRNCPGMSEGKMSRLRAELVCEESLYGVAQELSLGEELRLGRGEKLTGGEKRPSILADAVESVIAAIYLDGGLEPAQKLIATYILSQFTEDRKFVNRDYKTELQEKVQQTPGRILSYRLAEESGPDHNKSFLFEALLNDVVIGEGSGRSKKDAEQAAARDALEKLEQ